MRGFVLGARGVLWFLLVGNLCVTLVTLSGGSAAVMSMVAVVVLFISLMINYSLFDRKGIIREKTF